MPMRALMLVLGVLALAGCDGEEEVDAGPPAMMTDAGVSPMCRSASEMPGCTSGCNLEVPNCPMGYAVACPDADTMWQRLEEDGFRCSLTSESGPVPACSGGALVACPDGALPVCFPPAPICGDRCTGWGQDGCP